MYCQRCGNNSPDQLAYCQNCGNPLGIPVTNNPPYATPPPPPPPYYGAAAPYQPVSGPINYAGIGARFLASLMDGLILGIPIGIISTALSAMMAVRVIQRTSRDTSFNPGMAVDTIGTFFAGFGFIMIISLLLSWAYFALMESSAWQGTVGKKIMGLQVTDLNGSRISLGRATIRLAVKAFLSGWFLIGYIMAFFTQRKQALHDLIAGTLILSKQAYSAAPMGYPQQYPQQAPVNNNQVSSCPYCGATLQPHARFCSHCGRNL